MPTHQSLGSHSATIAVGASRLADGIDFIEDDDVQIAVVAHFLLLLLRIFEQCADIRFGLAHVLVQDLRAVHHLRLVRVQRLPDLPRDQRLAAARRAVQQHAAHVLDAHLAQHLRREHARGERAAEDVGELLVQTADAHRLEVESALKQTAVAAARAALDADRGVLLLLEQQRRGFHELAAGTADDGLRFLAFDLDELHARAVQAQLETLQIAGQLGVREKGRRERAGPCRTSGDRRDPSSMW